MSEIIIDIQEEESLVPIEIRVDENGGAAAQAALAAIQLLIENFNPDSYVTPEELLLAIQSIIIPTSTSNLINDGEGPSPFVTQDELELNIDDTLENANNYTDTAISTAVMGLLDDRGNYNPVTTQYPTTGGSGAGGAILKGDLWTISADGSVAGTLVTIGDVVRALSDSPAQVNSNWNITQNNIIYVPENLNNKVNSIIGNEASTVKYLSAKGSKDFVDSRIKDVNTEDTDKALSGRLANSLFQTYPEQMAGPSVGLLIFSRNIIWGSADAPITNPVIGYSTGGVFKTSTQKIYYSGATLPDFFARADVFRIAGLFVPNVLNIFSIECVVTSSVGRRFEYSVKQINNDFSYFNGEAIIITGVAEETIIRKTKIKAKTFKVYDGFRIASFYRRTSAGGTVLKWYYSTVDPSSVAGIVGAQIATFDAGSGVAVGMVRNPVFNESGKLRIISATSSFITDETAGGGAAVDNIVFAPLDADFWIIETCMNTVSGVNLTATQIEIRKK